MGLLKTENFIDRVYIYVTATGVAATGLAPTCTVIDESDNRTAGTVAEMSNGWYKITDFTPDQDGTWSTEWAVVGSYTIQYPFKIFKVGGGQEGSLITKVDVIDEYHDVPAQDAAANAQINEVIGNKTDTVGGDSIVALAKQIKAKTDNLPADPADDSDLDAAIAVIDGFHDVPAADSVNNSVMRDVVGNKTDDPDWFVTDDQSIMGYVKAAAAAGSGVSYAGVCDAGMGASLVTIVCDDLKGFGDDFFNTDWVMEVALNANSHGNAPEGNAPRDIQDYVSATGTFTVAAFSANVEANDRIIVGKRHLQIIDKTALAAVPAVNSFSYKISQYIADGDGDFAAGTPLPANTSLYDHQLTLATVAKQDVIDEYHDVPAQDAAANAQMNEVIGNKTDTVAGDSLVSLAKLIKAKTDNLPTDPADDSDLDTQLAAINAQNVIIDEFHDVPAQDSAANAQINEVIGNKTDTVGGDSLVALAKIIKAKTDNLPADPADDSDIDAQLVAITTAISGIQNNTRFTAAVPKYLTKPDAGDEAFRFAANLYDETGNMEDPVNSEILVRVIQDAGTFITANLYKENALTNGLDNPTDDGSFPNASGWRAMERENTGRYFFFYKVGSAETEESLTVEFGWDEGGNDNFQSRSTEVSDVHGDLTAILVDTAAIKAVTDALPDAGALTTIDTEIGVIDEYHDVPAQDAVANNQMNEVIGNKTDTVGGDSIVAIAKQIKAKTDNLPADPADDSDIDAQLVVIDEFHDVPAQDAAANNQINEVIGNKTDTVAGTSLVALVKIVDGVVDGIKSVTDALPDAGALTTIDTNVDDIETDTSDMQPRVPRITCHMDFWSNLQEEAQLGAGDEAGVIALPDVVVADLPAGVTITRAIAMFMCRAIENTNVAANAVDVATGHIEVRDDTPGAWTQAIDFPDNSFGVAASTREMGTAVFGDNDISGEVDGNDTYNFQFDDIGTDQDFLNLNDVQTGLRIYFTV